MALTTIDSIYEQLRDAIFDAHGWPTALATINNFVNSSGLVLLSADDRLRKSPCTESIAEMMDFYFSEGWHARDAREACLPLLMRNRVVLDDDFHDTRFIENTEYYNDFLSKYKQKWFAGVGAVVDGDLWCLAFQRSQDKGRFQKSDLARLKAVQSAFARSVGLASKVRNGWIAGALAVLQSSGEAAFLIDRSVSVLDANENARSILRPFINRRRQLELPDKRAGAELLSFVQECRDWRSAQGLDVKSIATHLNGWNCSLQILPLMQEDALLFYRAVALVKIVARQVSAREILLDIYKLTSAETRVVECLSEGKSLQEISDLFGVSINTTRSQLKSVYSKTQTGTQAKLLALMLHIRKTNDRSRS